MFILEGNIGAGKSTFLSLVKKELNIDIAYEPTDQWQHMSNGENILDLFYKDMPRWAYTFQSYAFITRIKKLKAFKSNKPVIAERSVYCDRFCFAKNCYERGVMSALEWELYQEWFAWLVKEQIGQPHGFIYLRVSPELCFERIAKRARSEESNVPLDYLRALHAKHEEWLIENKEPVDFLQNVPVLVIDGEQEFEADSINRDIMLGKVKHFVESINKSHQKNTEILNSKKEEFDKQRSMLSY